MFGPTGQAYESGGGDGIAPVAPPTPPFYYPQVKFPRKSGQQGSSLRRRYPYASNRYEGISENRIARLMQENELRARYGKPFRPKTTQVDKEQRFSPNLVAQSQCPESPGEIAVSDITYGALKKVGCNWR